VRGEIVLVIAGAGAGAAQESGEADGSDTVAARAVLLLEIDSLVAGGLTEKEALRQVARAHGLSRRDVYQLVKVEESPEPVEADDDDDG
jgi:16S rRNA C1402 (ribose-2'-O) methylase RsmI